MSLGSSSYSLYCSKKLIASSSLVLISILILTKYFFNKSIERPKLSALELILSIVKSGLVRI